MPEDVEVAPRGLLRHPSTSTGSLVGQRFEPDCGTPGGAGVRSRAGRREARRAAKNLFGRRDRFLTRPVHLSRPFGRPGGPSKVPSGRSGAPDATRTAATGTLAP